MWDVFFGAKWVKGLPFIPVQWGKKMVYKNKNVTDTALLRSHTKLGVAGVADRECVHTVTAGDVRHGWQRDDLCPAVARSSTKVNALP